MASSSINTVSASGNKNYISGLASGMDTESIVKSLLSGTQAKIDKQTGLKQQLEWKQDIYRDVIAKINTLGDKYFSYYGSGDTNLLSSKLYNTMTGASSSSAVKIGAVSSNAVKNMTINRIDQLATACTVKSKGTVTGAAQGGTVDLSEFQAGETYSFTATLDGLSRVITFQGGGADNEQKTLDNINQALYRNFGTSVGMNKDADGKMQLVQLAADGSATNTPIDSSRRVIIETSGDGSNTIKNLGFEGGFSNKLDYGTSLKNMNFATPLQGDRYEFEINGVTIKGLTGDSTLSDVLSAINSSGAGVTVSYSSTADKFIMQSSTTGAISDISMSQTYGNLLTTMFGVDATGVQSSLQSKSITAGDMDGLESVRTSLNSGEDMKFVFQVDGEDVTITLDGKKGSSTYGSTQEVVDAINSQFDKKFGTGAVRMKIEEDPTDSTIKTMVLSSADHEIGFSADNLTEGFASRLGFTEGDNLLTLNDSLEATGLTGKLKINGVEFDLDAARDSGGTVGDLMNFLEYQLGPDKVSFEHGRINIKDVSTLSIEGTAGSSGSPVKALFGQEQISLASYSGTGKPYDVTAGQNAKLTIDGVAIERNTNTFEIDGITMELTGKSTESIDLTTTRDTDKIVDSLKSFVEDYNSLIEELNGYLTEKATYRTYAPLTSEQKKEMSDKEIELWEEKSKSGLLRNDSNISGFLSDMRLALYSTVEGAGISLYDIGIETSDSWKDNGKLVIDEEKLKQAVATNADGIRKLFTDTEKGLAVQLQNAIKSAANVSSGSPGSLVRYAGTKDVLLTNNTLYNEMKSITETLANLNTKYEQEKTRYWKQFTAMEQAISNMNSQSSWLAQQFSS